MPSEPLRLSFSSFDDFTKFFHNRWFVTIDGAEYTLFAVEEQFDHQGDTKAYIFQFNPVEPEGK